MWPCSLHTSRKQKDSQLRLVYQPLPAEGLLGVMQALPTQWRLRLAAPTQHREHWHCGCHFRRPSRKERESGYLPALLTTSGPEWLVSVSIHLATVTGDTILGPWRCYSFLRGRYFHDTPVNAVGCHAQVVWEDGHLRMNAGKEFIKKLDESACRSVCCKSFGHELIDPPPPSSSSSVL